MAAKGVTLAATDFPLYTFRMVGDRHFLVAGGGGAAKTGVPNAIVRRQVLISMHNFRVCLLQQRSYSRRTIFWLLRDCFKFGCIIPFHPYRFAFQ